jgi:hypothetical protein
MRAAVNFVESESIAVISAGNSLRLLPVYLRESDHEPFVNVNGEWHAVENVGGFERYERRKLYNTATRKLVEV